MKNQHLLNLKHLRIFSLLVIIFFSGNLYGWQTPTITAPANGDTSNAGSFKLDWNAVATSKAYQVEIDTTPNFNSPVYRIETKLYTGTSNTGADNEFEYDKYLFGRMFYWRVRAYILNDTSAWSPTRNNFISRKGPVAIGASPMNQTATVFDWRIERNVRYYQFQCDTSLTFNSPAFRVSRKYFLSNNEGGSDSRQRIANSYYGATYYWRVRSRTLADSSDWSDTLTYRFADTLSGFSITNIYGGKTFPGGYINYDGQNYVRGYISEIDSISGFNSPFLKRDSFSVALAINGKKSFMFKNFYYDATYYFRAQTYNTKDTGAWGNFTFQTIRDCPFTAYNSPNSGSSTSISLNWLLHFSPSAYEIQYDTSSFFNSPLIKDTSVYDGGYVIQTNYLQLHNLHFGMNYFIRMRAINIVDTSEWSIDTVMIGNKGPDLIEPKDSSIQQTGLFFHWGRPFGIINFDLQVDTSPNFNSPLLNSKSINSVSTNYDVSYFIKNFYYGTTYYWHVRSRNNIDSSAWSVTWRFTTIYKGPALISPPNNSTAAHPSLSLNWGTHSYICSYLWEVDTSPGFNSPILNSGSYASTNFSLTGSVYYAKYYWHVRSQNCVDTAEWSDIWMYDISNSTPLHVSPTNSSNSLYPSVMIDWNAHKTSKAYFWEADTSALFNSPVKKSGKNPTLGNGDNGTDTRKKLVDLYYGTKYYWHVSSKTIVDTSVWSTPWTFNIGTAGPMLTLPLNLSVNLADTGIYLDWNAHDSVKYYEVQLDTTINFNSALLSNTIKNYVSFISNGNDTKWFTGTILYSTKYYWRVRAISNVDTSDWSTVYAFTTGPHIAIPVFPLQISPLNGDTLTTTSALLDWNAVAQVQTYTVKIDTTLLFNSPLLKSYTSNYINANDTNPDTQKQLSGLLLGKTYYWTVRCTNVIGNSPWSPVWLFKTPSTSVINTIVDDDEFILYPQPASEFVYLTAHLREGVAISVTILNLHGQLIQDLSFNYVHDKKIPLTGLNKGIYIIRIIAGGLEANKKLIIN